MKRIIVFILSIVYIASSVGATVHLHFCMDEFVSWSLVDKEGDECDNCGMKKNDNCCKDEHKFVKNTTDQKTAPAIQLVQLVTADLPVGFIGDPAIYNTSLIEKYPFSHAPPLITSVGLNILHCVFRI